MIRTHHPFPTQHALPNRLDFCGLHYDGKGYRIYVAEFASDNSEMFEIQFGSSVLAQRSMDEGSYLSMSWALNEASDPVGSIVLVTGSDFLEWFQEQSCGVYAGEEVKHVTVLTQNEWIEVLCLHLPTISKIRSDVLP